MTVQLRGLGVSPGAAMAPVAWLEEPARPPLDEPPAADIDAATDEVREALETVASDLESRAKEASSAGRDVLAATAAMARDPALLGAVREELAANLGPTHALQRAVARFAASLTAAGGLLSERVTDLHDVRNRALAVLLGVPMPGVPETDHPIVLAARDLAPADTVGLDPTRIVALLTIGGGPTSHTAIVAKSLGIPAVVACTDATGLAEGMLVLVDGDTGLVTVEPDRDTAAAAASRAADFKALVTRFSGPGRTSDGHHVALLVNIGTVADAVRVGPLDTEGVGLFRTEFLFLGREQAPTEEEQTEAYVRVLTAFGKRTVTVRTLDAGADKPLPFVDLGAEPNPALGARGLRVAIRHPELLDTQLAALARAAAVTEARLRVMAPMVATPSESHQFAALARAHGLESVGVMIEIPAAALRAPQLAAEVDFLSIGTNDLSQYTFAADRMAGGLAELLDPWQPALLDLVARTGEAGAESGVPVGVCGEAAGDPLLACVLVGLGMRSLSMAPAVLPAVRAALATHDLATCCAMAEAARAAATASDARTVALALAKPDALARH